MVLTVRFASFDRANDAVRVDASELRARIAAEGANLGFTQLARVEFFLWLSVSRHILR